MWKTTGFILAAFLNVAEAQDVDVSWPVLTDTVLTWNDYSRTGSCSVSTYPVTKKDKRSLVVVIDELGANRASPAISDARFLVQKIGRDFDIDPASAYWIFRWSADSYGVDSRSDKELLIQATFRWTRPKSLSGPSWRVIEPERLMELTDRQWE